MTFELLAAIGLALAVAFAATPLAMRVAAHTNFYDRPVAATYKRHARPTPYLGGAAVMAAFVVVLLVFGDDLSRTGPLLGAMAALWVTGTIDDRRSLSPRLRLVVEAALAVVIWAFDMGWDLGGPGALDALATAIWVIGVVNAFNLFDNMDGAAATMAGVVTATIAVLAALSDDAWLTVSAAALCGACLGFLPYNVASPARIFLGDGGSMPVGFGVAVLVMGAASEAASSWQGLGLGLLLVGIPALDTFLVIVSRRRRGVPILTGGRDHLTHRTRRWLRTPRGVAVALATSQALLAGLALTARDGGPMIVAALVGLYAVVAATVIALLDDIAHARPADEPATGWRRWVGAMPTGIVIIPLGLALGLSPLRGGFYGSDVWAAAGLGLIAILLALVIAQPQRLTRSAVISLIGLSGLAVWSYASRLWAPSVQDAVVNANRTMVLAALFGVLLCVVRGRREARWMLGVSTVAIAVVAAIVLVRMTFVDGSADMFVGGRLNDPLGYINGQGAIFVMGFFVCLAVAERATRPFTAGAGAAGMTLFGGLVVLSQSRGVSFGLAVALAFVFVAVPGRLRRAGPVLVAGIALTLAIGPLDDVYDAGTNGELDDLVVADAGRGLAVSTAFGWLAWTVVVAVLRNQSDARIRGLRRLAGIALGCGAIIALAGLASVSGRVASTVERQAEIFVDPATTHTNQATGTRLLSGSGYRYDYWRIAARTWNDHKLRGIGAGGYAVPYFQQRTSVEDVRQPHSLELQVLAELGLVGAAFLALFLGGIAAALIKHLRRHGERDPALIVASGGAFVAWLAQTSVDWLHLLPGVAGVALLHASVLLRATADRGIVTTAPPLAEATAHPDTRFRLRNAERAVVVFAMAAIIVLAVSSLARQVLAEHARRDARAALASEPERAVDLADRAVRFDPWDLQAYYVKAAALARFGDGEGARAALEEAVRRNPESFVAHALLGDVLVRSGEVEAARDQYELALRLNPREPSLQILAQNPRYLLEDGQAQ